MASRVVILLFTAFVMVCSEPSTALARQTTKARDIALPPISWTCPMHPEVLEAQPGICPICKMNLVAVRLETIWTCPVHAVIVEKKAGICPIDHRELVQMTVAMSWTCAGRSDIDQLTPGTCPDGSGMVAKFTQRPHGNHNPQHGGQFFMAPDNWHHLEGAFPRAGLVRIYLYDDYTRPLPLEQAKVVQGRIVTKEITDARTNTTREVAFPLTLTPDGRYLEAKVDSKAVPAPMVAKIKFRTDGPESRFDFTFQRFSTDPSAAAPAADPRLTISTSTTESLLAPPDPGQLMVIPDTVEVMVAELSVRNRQLRELIDRGALSEVYVPAFQAKALAIAIERHSAQLTPELRQRIEPSLQRLVRTAWLLDAFGDLGNRQQITAAYAGFESAVAEIESMFQTGRP